MCRRLARRVRGSNAARLDCSRCTARVHGLDRGVIEVGRAADLVIADAPEGSTAGDALGALAIGDLPGISMILVDGAPVIGRSRNTAPAARQATVVNGPAVGGGGH